MRQPNIRLYLEHVYESIQGILEYTAGKSYEDYLSEKLLRKGVERELEIIGEAMGKALKIQSDLPFTNARRIVDTRNLLIHGYDEVEDTVVWGIIRRHIPVLKAELEEWFSKNENVR